MFHLHQDIPNTWDAWDVDIFYKERCEVVEGLEKLELVGVRPAARPPRGSSGPSANPESSRESS